MKKILLMSVLIFGFNTLLSAQISLPYFNDFETDTIGWYSDTFAGDSFHWDSTNYVGCSGLKGLGVGIDTSGTFTALYSPLFDFSNVSNASLCLTHKYDATFNIDGVRLEYCINNSVWDILGNTMVGTNWYNAPAIMSSALPAWSGTLTNCIQSSISLNMLNWYNTVQFRFIPTMDATLGEYFLDDFRICISPCTCDSVVSVAELSESDFSIYPNPANNSFTITKKSFNRSDFSIYNSANQQVFKGELNTKTTIHSDHFTPGIYFIKIIDKRNCIVKKIIITSH